MGARSVGDGRALRGLPPSGPGAGRQEEREPARRSSALTGEKGNARVQGAGVVGRKAPLLTGLEESKRTLCPWGQRGTS